MFYNITEEKTMKLKKLREENGLSQEQVAKILGINRVSLSKIENGKQKIDPILLYKLAKLYNVDAYKLIGMKKPKPIEFAFRDKDKISSKAEKKLNKIKQYIKKIIELEELSE